MSPPAEGGARCPNDHPVQWEMVFCPRCGAYRDAPPPPNRDGQQPARWPPAGRARMGRARTAPSRRSTNGMAVASLVLGILWLYGLGSLLAVILGALALGQMGRRPQAGRRVAILGVVLGAVGIVGAVVFGLVLAGSTGGSSG